MLASVIRELIAPELPYCPKECGIVTITEVDVSRDFSYATVYVSAMAHSEHALEHFKDHARELQHRLSVLKRKRIPLLRFRIDQRSERAARLDALFKKEGER
jgi:ribosome-binding factor A